uniref:Uncharacterized protein n=1 Tax=Meloidogyne enterolobii TaxID=390850 RepID=A0A6V7VHL3_MELEN|nr:unnamed protein product [Meloidogyne enterolobii]
MIKTNKKPYILVIHFLIIYFLRCQAICDQKKESKTVLLPNYLLDTKERKNKHRSDAKLSLII